MRHFKSKPFHFSLTLAVLLAGAAFFYIQKHYTPPPILDIPKQTQLNPKPSNPIQPFPTNTQDLTPKTFLLKVPFSPQAPTANWDELHNEGCEETSAIMAGAYYNNNHNDNLVAPFVEDELTKITDWEKKTFGYYLDIDANETAQLLRDYYGLQTKLVKNITEEEIKKELSQNHLIIWSANGRKLGNPNFKQPGPPYHMLVIKGWNSFGFITNDPGTRKGRNYMYSYEVLYNAAGAWSHNLNAVDEGDKTAIVVYK